VTESELARLSQWCYGLAALAYVAFAARLALGSGAGRRAAFLLVTVGATTVWAAASFAFALQPGFGFWGAAAFADTARYAAWFLFLRVLLVGDPPNSGRIPVPNSVIAAMGLALVASLATPFAGSPFASMPEIAWRPWLYAVWLVLAVSGLILLEQLFRETDPGSRWAIKPLVIGLAGLFAFDLYFYSDAMLFGRIDAEIWIARALAHAVIIPFVAVATARNAAWTIEIHVSRGTVFHSTAIVVSGLFLLVIAFAGYLVRYLGGDWGRALQIGFLFAALLAGALVLTSGRFRSKLRVFVSKHFFSYRYDYRQEWLRFTATLSDQHTLRGVQEQVVKGLCDLVESPGGALWLRQEDETFRLATRLNVPATVDGESPAGDSLPRFLAGTGWVVDVPQFRRDRSAYDTLELPDWLAAMKDAWLIIPLVSGVDLLGFVVLSEPRAKIDVNWEVRDLLKVASRQAASFLGQTRATEALLEARKFEAFNRMSAFVVHDLKNLVAQLSLMLRNAERHRDNPEFQRDMLQTVEHVVGRMNHLMSQLRSGVTPAEKTRPVDLVPVVERACRARHAAEGRVKLALVPGLLVLAHEDRLDHVIGHLLQNALDATAAGGEVSVRTRQDGRHVVLEIADTGVGMTPEFVRDRLFKPFETSKKTGMGIGVYESSQYLSTIGGQLQVESAPGAGTTVRALMPASDVPAASRSQALA
jgi:putative PEP-CTERM system histidine kinase